MPTHSHAAQAALPAREQVIEGVKEVVGEHMGIPVEQIRDDDALENDLGCDSLDVVEIVMETEEQFGISVPDDIGDGVRTIADMVDGVLRLLAEQQSPLAAGEG